MNSLFVAGTLLAVARIAVAGPGADDGTFTLYRNSPMYPEMRIHVATFDAVDGERYNAENCQIARDLFEGQPRVKVRYWCEKGRFRN